MTKLADVRSTVVKEFAINLHEVRINASFQDPLSPEPNALVLEIVAPNYRATTTYAEGSQMHSMFLALVTGKIDSDPTIEKLPDQGEVGEVGVSGLSAAQAKTRALK
jgi:hypothetical protein